MKNITFILLFFVGLSYSQKIDIKKDKLLYNDKEIALVKIPYRDHYEFYTFNNFKVFEADLKGVSVGLYYLDMKDANGKTTQIPYEVLMTSFKPARLVAYLLTVKYKLFDNNGINQNEVENFFNTPRENLADKYLQAKVESIASENEKKSRLGSIMSSYNPRIGSRGEILYNNGNYPAKIAGYAKAYNCAGFSNKTPCVEISDLDGIRVASMYQSDRGIRTYLVKTFDGNEFTFNATRSYAPADYAFISELVANMIIEGYTLEHQASYKNQELQEAKVRDAIDRSINLYEVPGYIIDKSGKKTEGLISIWFEKLDTERTGQRLPNEGADIYGQKVTLKTTLPGGGNRTKVYNANSGVQFCINNSNGEDCYVGLDVKGELMKKLQNYGDLHANTAYFYKLIKKEKRIMLLQDPVERQKYVIKTDIQQKGQMLDNRSNEKLAIKLADYLKDCKPVSDDLKKESLDLKDEENLITLLTAYSNCKK